VGPAKVGRDGCWFRYLATVKNWLVHHPHFLLRSMTSHDRERSCKGDELEIAVFEHNKLTAQLVHGSQVICELCHRALRRQKIGKARQ
jgi:hypothetical protein